MDITLTIIFIAIIIAILAQVPLAIWIIVILFIIVQGFIKK